MNENTLGIILILLSIWRFWNTERVRRKPELFLSGFMVSYVYSLVVFIYGIGQTRQEIPKMLATDENMRQKYLIESYLLVLLGIAISIFLFLR